MVDLTSRSLLSLFGSGWERLFDPADHPGPLGRPAVGVLFVLALRQAVLGPSAPDLVHGEVGGHRAKLGAGGDPHQAGEAQLSADNLAVRLVPVVVTDWFAVHEHIALVLIAPRGLKSN